jgi:hypothetical protein
MTSVLHTASGAALRGGSRNKQQRVNERRSTWAYRYPYLGIYRDRPSSAHSVTTITPPHGARRHYAARANPNEDDAYDGCHPHESGVARQAPPGPLIPATRTLALVLRYPMALRQSQGNSWADRIVIRRWCSGRPSPNRLTGVPPRADNIRGDKLRPTKKLVSSSPHPATCVRLRSLS